MFATKYVTDKSAVFVTNIAFSFHIRLFEIFSNQAPSFQWKLKNFQMQELVSSLISSFAVLLLAQVYFLQTNRIEIALDSVSYNVEINFYRFSLYSNIIP